MWVCSFVLLGLLIMVGSQVAVQDAKCQPLLVLKANWAKSMILMRLKQTIFSQPPKKGATKTKEITPKHLVQTQWFGFTVCWMWVPTGTRVSCEVTPENTGKPEVIPISKPVETRELFCSETAERGEATPEVRIDRVGMRTVEEGLWVREAALVPEWWEAGISSRLLCASFCGRPPETSGSYRGGKIVTLKAELGFIWQAPCRAQEVVCHHR